MPDPAAYLHASRTPRLIDLQPTDVSVKHLMAPLLTTWCRTGAGRTDPRLTYRTTSSCDCPSTTGHWTIEASMLDRYGPLPFTARGKPIRWRWWHTVLGDPEYTVTATDLPDRAWETE